MICQGCGWEESERKLCSDCATKGRYARQARAQAEQAAGVLPEWQRQRNCQGCGAAVPAMRHPGNGRKWCSEACRVKHVSKPKPLKYVLHCGHCEHEFRSADRDRIYCSPACSSAPKELHLARRCKGCDQPLVRNGKRIAKQVYCSRACWSPPHLREARKRAACARHNAQRRARRLGRSRVGVDWRVIGERDHWTCHLCQEPVGAALRGSIDQLAPEIDHVLELADGGHHLPSNLRLAHRKCNADKERARKQRLREAKGGPISQRSLAWTNWPSRLGGYGPGIANPAREVA